MFDQEFVFFRTESASAEGILTCGKPSLLTVDHLVLGLMIRLHWNSSLYILHVVYYDKDAEPYLVIVCSAGGQAKKKSLYVVFEDLVFRICFARKGQAIIKLANGQEIYSP